MTNKNVKDSKNKSKRIKRVIFAILIDLLLIVVGLVIFALFHHVIPDTSQVDTIVLVTPNNDPTPSPTPQPVEDLVAEPTISPEPTDYGMWGEKFNGKFTKGDQVINTDYVYISHDINVRVTRMETVIFSKVTYYVADIYIRNIDNFKTAFAGGQYAKGVTDTVLNMDIENDAVVGITGDYYGIRSKGLVVRNGVLYREKLWEDLLVMNNDGSMETFYKDDFNMDELIANGAYQAWSFGPMLLDDGQPMTKFNSTVSVRNPRSSIGYYEPGHYCFILVDGRQDGYSRGMSLGELSQLYYDMGCVVAYNLDGGQSSVMTFNDQIANIPYKGGRKISDILFIGEIGDE